jgi:hypothetical protein
VFERMAIGNWKCEKNIQALENKGVGKLREEARPREEYLKTEGV